ncbi:hypothetical protein MtrunA17_Chr5g0407581 [Medicago truncatula]|uniref:Transmembrane protein n=1 Tax=Medicago truncatula TaxID=3880 RepID=A0A396HMA4_MEDTR|nr:hypothetical protein MtrunA17_Chr5g0407581 [Medicago truncatula]
MFEVHAPLPKEVFKLLHKSCLVLFCSRLISVIIMISIQEKHVLR